MFDCVLPTRFGRTGAALTGDGRINLRNARYARDPRPLVEGCGCPACGDFSRAYIRHLVMQDEIVGLRLLTLHNLHHLIELVGSARRAIVAGRFAEFRGRAGCGCGRPHQLSFSGPCQRNDRTSRSWDC